MDGLAINREASSDKVVVVVIFDFPRVSQQVRVSNAHLRIWQDAVYCYLKGIRNKQPTFYFLTTSFLNSLLFISKKIKKRRAKLRERKKNDD